MMLLIAEYTARSIVLGLLVFLALKALRIEDPRLERTAWRIVLASALLMPAILELGSLSPMPTPTLSASYTELLTFSAPSPVSNESSTVVLALLSALSGALVIRHCFGIARCWAMRRRARRLSSNVHDGLDVRMSDEVKAPATVFSTILVPTDFDSWSAEARRLAIAHERSHLASKDFYVQWLAQLYRNIFWFNPFAWWLASRLALLNEHVSDDAAIDGRDERTTYAQVLLNLARRGGVGEYVVPMIRNHSLGHRIKRILQQSNVGESSVRRTLLAACVLAPIVAATAAIRSPSNRDSDIDNSDVLESGPGANANIVLPKSNPTIPLSAPRYPSASRQLGQTGTVVLRLLVLEDGSVADAKITQSSGYPDLDYAAFYETFRWRLSPGTIDGMPARMWGRFAVTFKLNND
ncbi:MAG TPA: M56 family metallopeptidase [Steroidobacter sp.]|uniref:M56 family metallopeptidase n=1 Tax=Steroidobacter sp. TaxID=1978227 RepID=UPI002ED81E59